MRLLFTLFTLCILAFQGLCQSGRPLIEIGKRERHHKVRPFQLDSSTNRLHAIYFRTDSTMKWKKLSKSARLLKPYMEINLALEKRFNQYQNTKSGATLLAIGAPTLYFGTVISLGLHALINSYEIRPNAPVPPRNNTMAYMAVGIFAAGVGCTIGTFALHKKARRQLVNLIIDYNDHRLSVAPASEKHWSLSLGLSSTGNSVGLGLRLRPN